MGDEEDDAGEVAEEAEGHGEAELVGEARVAAAEVFKGVIVLEGAEAAGEHAVAEEAGRVIGLDEAFVELGQAELPALPADAVAGGDQAFSDEACGAGAAGAGDGAHAELVLHDGEVGGEQETALDGGMDDDGFGDLEGMGHAFALVFDDIPMRRAGSGFHDMELCRTGKRERRWWAGESARRDGTIHWREMGWHEWSFAAALRIASGATALYERLRPAQADDALAPLPGVRLSRHTIASGKSRLDAIFAEPMSGGGRVAKPRAVLLICHGIGEIVEWWLPVQRLLAGQGVASLVFNYTGYGRSTGKISARQLEDDAVASFGYLERLLPGEPVSVLGFSLGTGVAAAAIGRMPAHRLVLCAGFPSFQEGAFCVGVPRSWKRLTPPIWRAEESMRGVTLPVLVVHGEEDALFPVELGRALHAACGEWAEWLLVPGQGHNQPFNQPTMHYWGPVVRWLVGEGARG